MVMKNSICGENTLGQKLGYGYIDLLELYNEAYNAGSIAGELEGGSGGGSTCLPGLPC